MKFKKSWPFQMWGDDRQNRNPKSVSRWCEFAYIYIYKNQDQDTYAGYEKSAPDGGDGGNEADPLDVLLRLPGESRSVLARSLVRHRTRTLRLGDPHVLGPYLDRLGDGSGGARDGGALAAALVAALARVLLKGEEGTHG